MDAATRFGCALMRFSHLGREEKQINWGPQGGFCLLFDQITNR